MGRKLNLSHLSDGECRQILDVIQRDFRLRQREKERIGKLKKKVEEEEEKRSVLSRQHAFNQKHCMRCFSAFGLLFNKRGQCVVCHYFFCKDCRLCVHSIMWICKGCITERQLQSQAFEWYYDKIKERFRRYGSAKVVRSLYKRKSNEFSESPSDQSNTDSGFEHQLSPRRRDNSIPLEDKSTNTDKDLLESMRPDMENVSTQWPPASRRNSFRSESLSPDSETWQNIRLDPNVYKNNTNEISVEVFCEKMPTSPISKVITQHDRFSSGIQTAIDPTISHLKSLSPIPEMSSPECTEDVLGMIGENDAEEKGLNKHKNHCTRSRGIFGKINGSPLRLIKRGYPRPTPDDIDINMIEENAKNLDEEPEIEANEVLGSRSSKQIRLEKAQEESVSVSDVSLASINGTEVDSLETQCLSGHSNLTTPEVENDSPSTPSTPVPGMLSLGKNCGPNFWDDITLPHSSSSETLKSDQGEPNSTTKFFSTEEFLDEITNRSPTSRSPCSSEDDFKKKSNSKSRQGSEDRTSPSSLASAKSYSTEYHTAQSELDSRVQSPQSAKTTCSSEYFTAFSEFSETKEDEQNNNTRDSDDSLSYCSSHESLSANSEDSKINLPQSSGARNVPISAQAGASAACVYARESDELDEDDDEETPNNSPTNKLIRYDSLSLVVEVSEDDGDLLNPPVPAYHMPRFGADYDSGHDSYSSESSVDQNRRRALRHYFRDERRLSPSSEEDPHSRQASFDSVESYSHKSPSLSSRQASTESTRTSDAALSRKSSPDVEHPANAECSPDVDGQARNTEVCSELVIRESDMFQKTESSETNDTLNSKEHSESKIRIFTKEDCADDKLLVVNQPFADGNSELCTAVSKVVSDVQSIDEDTCLNGAQNLREGLTPHEHPTPEEETIRSLIKTVPSIMNSAAIILQSPPEKRKTAQSTKAELDLTNLSKKVLMRRDEVLESAEEMLSSATQMSDINDQMEELEHCLSSLEKTLAGDSDSDHEDCKQNGGDLSPQDQVVEDVHKLEQKLQVHDHCLGMETEQTAAVAVRMITNTALKVIATTENVIQTEHAQFASSDINKIQSEPCLESTDESSDSILNMRDLQETSVDDFQQSNLITNANEMQKNMQVIHNSSVTLQDATPKFCTTEKCLQLKQTSVEENGNCFVNDHSTVTHSTLVAATDSMSSSHKAGARRKESVNGCRKKLKRMVKEEHNARNMDEVANEIIHLEEKVYLSASHVFSLEDKLNKLESQVQGLDITASEELIGGLEDELALTLAQVAHSENQVCSAEDRIDQLKARTGFVQGEKKEDRFPFFIKNVSGSFQTSYLATVNKPVNDGCVTSGSCMVSKASGFDMVPETSDRSIVPTISGSSMFSETSVSNMVSEISCSRIVPDTSDSSIVAEMSGNTVVPESSGSSRVTFKNDLSNRNEIEPKEIYCSSIHGDDIDGEYALESDEDEIFLVASSSLQTDLYQKSNSYGTFTRSLSQPEVGTSKKRKEHSFDDKRSVSDTDVSWDMPGLCSLLDDSNIEFHPYSSSEEFSDDSQRINNGSDCSQRSDSSNGNEKDHDGSGNSQINNGNHQRNDSSDSNQSSSGGSQKDSEGSVAHQNDNIQMNIDNGYTDNGQRNYSNECSQEETNGSDCGQRSDHVQGNSICDSSPMNTTDQNDTGDLISFNVNEEGLNNATCDNTPVDPAVTHTNVSSLVFSSGPNFNSTIDHGHIESRIQTCDIQFQNDLLTNSSYVES